MPRGGSEKRPLDWHIRSAKRRIEIMSMPEPNSGCWLWLHTLDRHGYGKVGSRNKVVAAHRLSFEVYVSDPGNMQINHHCDVSSCVNPEHLYAGTQQENIDDCIRRGRFRPGGKLFA
jgi:hypothetical protein